MWPSIRRNWYEKEMKLRFTALSMSSMDMNTVMMLLRKRNPATPIANRTALRMRYQDKGTGGICGMLIDLPLRENYGAENGDENQNGDNLERQEIFGK